MNIYWSNRFPYSFVLFFALLRGLVGSWANFEVLYDGFRFSMPKSPPGQILRTSNWKRRDVLVHYVAF